MIDLIPMLYGIPIEGIERDIKDGKYILKSRGNINSNIKAQTVIVYGDVKGNIKADQVVVINGKATGNIHADTVMGLKDKRAEKTEKKVCDSCKFLYNHNDSQDVDYCEKLKILVIKKGDICGFYQEKKRQDIPTSLLRELHINKREIRQKGK